MFIGAVPPKNEVCCMTKNEFSQKRGERMHAVQRGYLAGQAF
jgi:hypothetical protein